MTGRDFLLPAEAATKAATTFTARRRRWLADPDAAESDTLAIGLRAPSEAQVAHDPDAARDWVRAWESYDGPGDVDWVRRRWPSFGTHDIPTRVVYPGATAIAAAARKTSQWRRLIDRRAALIALVPEPAEPLSSAVATTATAWDALDDNDFGRMITALRWLLANPASGLLIRQLPVPGVDTKWVTRHRGLVESLLAAMRGDGALGVRTLPRLVDVAILDRALLPGAPRVFAASTEELAALPVYPSTVLILENKEGVHALPDLPGAVAVHGSGYVVHELATLPWLARADIVYWGDLDTHGFAILDRLRQHLPAVRSMLMDCDTFSRWRYLSVPEPSAAAGALAHLTPDEASALEIVRTENLRLEQERIPWNHVLEQISAALTHR
ncbi:Wadjet anti-phage system protein JetD domain-containing protein [Rhodococcus sp. NPDC058521]|uniref:Wadjet anti-phage system protein JetD domain-containing protein n=1 Tax=Rhodococcus sp. NPDC058521 TaxID=3346536 RepID=UPI0036676DA1